MQDVHEGLKNELRHFMSFVLAMLPPLIGAVLVMIVLLNTSC